MTYFKKKWRKTYQQFQLTFNVSHILSKQFRQLPESTAKISFVKSLHVLAGKLNYLKLNILLDSRPDNVYVREAIRSYAANSRGLETRKQSTAKKQKNTKSRMKETEGDEAKKVNEDVKVVPRRVLRKDTCEEAKHEDA